jgi:hypothetical protein
MAEEKMMDVNENEVFDWDSEIEVDSEDRDFIVLEPGEYDFEVVSFERGTHEAKAGGKAPTCPKAIIKIKIATEAGDAYLTENFLLYKKMEWKISDFFRSIGLKKEGEKVPMKWEDAVGCTGTCKVTKDKGNEEGIFFNHVKSWIKKKEGDSEWN